MTVNEFFEKLNNGATWSAGVSFKRANPLPLERYAVHASYADAEAYATSNAVAYPGQIIAVVEDAATAVYYIDHNMALQPVGVLPSGDGKTVVMNDDGTISLYGLDGTLDEAKSYQAIYKDGALTWVELSSTTVEGLQALVEGLQSDVDNLEAKDAEIEAKIGTVAEGKTLVEMIADAQAAATYDDTALSGRVTAIEDDYLKTADKTELQAEIAAAKSEAITEAVETVLGEGGVSEDFDTLKEVAAWIQSDTTSSAELITRVSAIENDYLKGADKTELQGAIDELETFVGELPEGAVSTTVVAYIQEVVDGLNIGDYAKADELTALAARVTAIEEKVSALEAVGAEKNIIATVNETDFTVDEERKLNLNDIPMSKVTGLPAALEDKVDKVEGSRLMTSAEAEKLEKLVLGEDGSVEVSGTIAAGNVDGLADWITARAATLKGLSENNLTDERAAKLDSVAESANQNVIEIVKIGGVAASVNDEDKSVDIPIATAVALGTVKGSTAENGVSIAADGTMSVNNISMSKITQADEDTLILDGGNSAQ